MNRPYIKRDVIQKVKMRKLNRPHIKADVIQQVKLRKLEEEKASLTRQREFLLEQQRQAFLYQQFVNSSQMIVEELDEEQGMSM